MCGVVQCPDCGDMSYGCGPFRGLCDCSRDFSRMTRKEFDTIMENETEGNTKLLKQRMKFIEIHGFKEEEK